MAADYYLSPWLGQEFLDKLKDDFNRKLTKACIHLANECKKELSDPYPPASAPNMPPHRRGGELRRSVAWEVDKAKSIGRVGSNKIYARYSEIGTSIMKPRPWLRPTLAKQQNKINEILTGE